MIGKEPNHNALESMAFNCSDLVSKRKIFSFEMDNPISSLIANETIQEGASPSQIIEEKLKKYTNRIKELEYSSSNQELFKPRNFKIFNGEGELNIKIVDELKAKKSSHDAAISEIKEIASLMRDLTPYSKNYLYQRDHEKLSSDRAIQLQNVDVEICNQIKENLLRRFYKPSSLNNN